MSAKDRTPTTRLLALAAFILAAGLLSLRGYDLLAAPSAEPVGGAMEKELTYLLEPITGRDRIRVSVTGHSPKTVLIMVDGEFASDLRPMRARIEPVLIASINFNPETDRLSLSQFPFARGAGRTLTPLQIAELTGLGLLSLMLLISLLTPTTTPRASTPAPAPRQPETPIARAARTAPVAIEPDNGLRTATALAETKPNETANLVRSWMSYTEE